MTGIYNIFSVHDALNNDDMAKRLTDTEKFKSKFVRSLKAPYKLLWEYILCDCNHAGIWIVDFEAARMYLGKDIRVLEKQALEAFNKEEKHVIPIDDGEKWFIVGFIEFQYGALNPKNRVHASVIKMLERYGLWHDGHIDLEMNNVPARKIPKLEGSDDLEALVIEKKPASYEHFNFDFVSYDFKVPFYTWLEHKRSRREKYKTQTSLEKAYKRMLNLSGSVPSQAQKVVDQAIANNWAGLYALNDKASENVSSTGGVKDYGEWKR